MRDNFLKSSDLSHEFASFFLQDLSLYIVSHLFIFSLINVQKSRLSLCRKACTALSVVDWRRCLPTQCPRWLLTSSKLGWCWLRTAGNLWAVIFKDVCDANLKIFMKTIFDVQDFHMKDLCALVQSLGFCRRPQPCLQLQLCFLLLQKWILCAR